MTSSRRLALTRSPGRFGIRAGAPHAVVSKIADLPAQPITGRPGREADVQHTFSQLLDRPLYRRQYSRPRRRTGPRRCGRPPRSPPRASCWLHQTQKCFAILSHGSLSVREDRLGLSEQPSSFNRTKGRATDLRLETECLAELYRSARLFVNLFQPSFKLIARQRDGARVRKTYSRQLRRISVWSPTLAPQMMQSAPTARKSTPVSILSCYCAIPAPCRSGSLPLPILSPAVRPDGAAPRRMRSG